MRLYIQPGFTDGERRECIFQGDLVLYQPSSALRALTGFARELAGEYFAPYDPQTAQNDLAVEAFVERLAALKTAFTNDLQTKLLMQTLLFETGHDPQTTWFDVPRLRAVTSGGYLRAGVGYAYKPHRDTWYAAPPSQINWWIPLHELEASQALLFYPQQFGRAVENSSQTFDYGEWQREGRPGAKTQVRHDRRNHPLPQQALDPSTAFAAIMPANHALVFSAAQLHETAENTSGKTRFSIDFRTFATSDIDQGRGAVNYDGAARGSTVPEFLNAFSLKPYGEVHAAGRSESQPA